MSTTLPASPIPSLQTLELTSAQAPLLQRFFDDNTWTRDSARRWEVTSVEQALARIHKK